MWRIIESARVVQDDSNPCRTGILVGDTITPIGEGGVSSWNDLTDKPFDAEFAFEPIVANGRIEDFQNIDASALGLGILCKISDIAIPKEYLYHASYRAGDYFYNIEPFEAVEQDGYSWGGLCSLTGFCTVYIICVASPFTYGGAEVEKGTWISFNTEITGFDFSIVPPEIIKPLDAKYLPDVSATKHYVDTCSSIINLGSVKVDGDMVHINNHFYELSDEAFARLGAQINRGFVRCEFRFDGYTYGDEYDSTAIVFPLTQLNSERYMWHFNSVQLIQLDVNLISVYLEIGFYRGGYVKLQAKTLQAI